MAQKCLCSAFLIFLGLLLLKGSHRQEKLWGDIHLRGSKELRLSSRVCVNRTAKHSLIWRKGTKKRVCAFRAGAGCRNCFLQPMEVVTGPRRNQTGHDQAGTHLWTTSWERWAPLGSSAALPQPHCKPRSERRREEISTSRNYSLNSPWSTFSCS